MASKVLDDMIAELDYYNIKYDMPDIPLDSAQNINLVRNKLKVNIERFKEEQYALRQADEWQEIYEYMNLLIVNNGREKELGDDYTIKVPKSEAAAYLEWIFWKTELSVFCVRQRMKIEGRRSIYIQFMMVTLWCVLMQRSRFELQKYGL